MVGRLQEIVEQETRARSAAAAERLGLPPSIQLPDGEYGQDAHLQLRVPYQVSKYVPKKVILNKIFRNSCPARYCPVCFGS